MLAIERRHNIICTLQKEKSVLVSELSKFYSVSEETIRRDLDKLEKDGIAIKSYGGAVIREDNNSDLPFSIRKNTNIAEKKIIADLITTLIQDGERLMLDASSTAVFIAKSLKIRKDLTIITNSIEILIELIDMPEWYVLSTGGISQEGAFSLAGDQTDRMLNNYHVDTAVISCKGLDLSASFTDSNELHAKNKQTMLSCASKKILVADHSKFKKIAFTKIGDFNDITMIVTDQKPETEWLQFFETANINCLYPQ